MLPDALRKFSLTTLALLSFLFVTSVNSDAQTAARRPLIAQPIDEANLVTLTGNTRPEAAPQNDLGPVEDGMHLDLYLQLKRSPDQELAARQFVESLTDKASPNFHRWITAAEYGQRFGAAPEDIAAVCRWLQSHGFAVTGVPAHNMVVAFSGTAGQARRALHTDIHYLNVSGKRHFANMSDPQIPAALLPAVTGVVSLNDFKPVSMLVPKSQYTISATNYAVVPGDLATIYNLNPLFAAGYTGQGQTIVLIEDTDLYSGTADWASFRKVFALDRFASATLTQVHPSSSTSAACSDPGVNSDSDEAALDVEWASAAAPGASIVLASCSGVSTMFGGFIALQNLLTNGSTPPSVVSISYGLPETVTGAAQNSYINTLYQLAAAQGVSVFVSSGDAAGAAADRGNLSAVFGITVSSFASTIYNVAVGGTDFGDAAAGTSSTYWNPANTAYYDSAKSYVPEIPWNDTCGSGVAASYYGFATSYGANGYCNAFPYYAGTTGGSGGPSACATGSRSIGYAVSGTCAGWPKPTWQSVPGNPGDNVRDLPDVSLFAASGIWGHFYVFCDSQYTPCTSAPSSWPGGGGTSFSSPIMAGIQSLINQALGVGNSGNPNPVYYEIARSQYSSTPGAPACNSSAGPASGCAFNDVTRGDIVVPCSGSFNCFLNGEAIGVLSTSNTSFQPAYAATPAWDFATGIGTVNAANLLNAFVGSVAPSLPPAAPALVSPSNAATAVSPTPTLTWNASAGAASYDVYFGTSTPPPLVTNTVSLNYSPGSLSAATTYYWAIGARNTNGATASSPSSFTTDCVAALSPSGAAAPAAGTSASVPVTAPDGCSWKVASNAPWITVSSGASGTGNGAVAYTVAPTTGPQRTGTLSIGSQTFTVTQAQIYPIISAFAGGAAPPASAPGSSVSIALSFGLAVDSSGNVYFPSPNLNAVFKADPTGLVTQVAGTGIRGQRGDGGPALSAQLNYPTAIAVDSAGDLFIADSDNCRIRKVVPSGTITTVAGTGGCGYDGDGGPATLAELYLPDGLAVDGNGNLFIADTYNHAVRVVNSSGVISTLAGTGVPGYSGDSGPAALAQLRYPYGLAVDGSGNVYVADSQNYRIRKIANGTMTTVAGNGVCCSGDGASAVTSRLGTPIGVALDSSGNLYVAEASNSRIRKLSPAGVLSTVAGTLVAGYSGDNGPALAAQFRTPDDVAVDSSGNLYVADTGNSRIRLLNATSGTISTLVGGGVGDGGPAVFASFNIPLGIVRDANGNTYVADTYNSIVRRIAPNGSITTIAGSAVTGFAGDGGPAVNAQLNFPVGLALDSSGNLYIADSNNHRVRMVDPSGGISTVAGNGVCCSATGDNGPALSAQIGIPYSLAIDPSGNLYIGDTTNNLVRQVATSGTITTYAGTGSAGYSGDAGPASKARLYGPYGLATDSSGNLYIGDRYNYRVRMVSPAGTITTFAGNGLCCFSGDGGKATAARLDDPSGIAVDAAGNVYIADTYNQRVRVVLPNGNIATLAGNGAYGYVGDGGAAIGAEFRYPFALAIDASGTIAVTDESNNAVRLLTPIGVNPVLTIQSAHAAAFTPSQSGVYALTVSNAPGAAPTSGTITVTEMLPAGLSLASMSGPGWTCSSASCTRSDALTGGSSYPPITVAVTVAANAAAQLTNQALVTGGASQPAGAEDLTLIVPSSSPTQEVMKHGSGREPK